MIGVVNVVDCLLGFSRMKTRLLDCVMLEGVSGELQSKGQGQEHYFRTSSEFLEIWKLLMTRHSVPSSLRECDAFSKRRVASEKKSVPMRASLK